MFSKLKYIVVSSAYIKNLYLLFELTKSLIIILKNNGPKIEACGIPVLISNKSYSEFSNRTYWNWIFLNRYDPVCNVENCFVYSR